MAERSSGQSRANEITTTANAIGAYYNKYFEGSVEHFGGRLVGVFFPGDQSRQVAHADQLAQGLDGSHQGQRR